MIDLNIKEVLYEIAVALPHMQKQKSGQIDNTASVFVISPFQKQELLELQPGPG
jgi:NADP-dependent 3-hydroxy acid dehydrogenase YdfG